MGQVSVRPTYGSGRYGTAWRGGPSKRGSTTSLGAWTSMAFTQPRPLHRGLPDIRASRCCSCRPPAPRRTRLTVLVGKSMTSAPVITSAHAARSWGGRKATGVDQRPLARQPLAPVLHSRSDKRSAAPGQRTAILASSPSVPFSYRLV